MVIIKSTKCLKKRKGFDMAYIRQLANGAEVFYGMPVIRKVKGQFPHYAEFTHLKTGELVGIEEGRYLLLQKDGKLIEKTTKSDSPYKYTAISDAKTGKVELLSEDNDIFAPSLTLTQDQKGNITTLKKYPPLEDLLNAPRDMAAQSDAINAVREYNGLSLLSPEQIYNLTSAKVMRELGASVLDFLSNMFLRRS